MGKWLVALVLAVAFVAGLAGPTGRPTLGPGPVRAQGIEVTAQDVANSFPDEIVFRLSAGSDADIQEVTVRYEILPDGVPAYGVPQFEPGGQVQVDFHLDANDGQLYLAPGAEILYHWEIEDAAGNTLSTEPATFVYQDTRYDWVAGSEGNVSVHWYGGGDAESYLRVARDTLDRMSALLGAQVDFPVKVWVYDDNDDMLAALPRRSQGQEIERRTAGVRVASDTVLMLADGGGDILRHELTHVVTSVAGEGPYGGLPAWLDEGTAMYAQSEPGEGFTSALDGAVDRDRLLSVRSMTSPTGDPDKVTLFYGEAWSLVSFMVEEYGEGKFAQLYAVFKDGSTTDDALRRSTASIRKAWRTPGGSAWGWSRVRGQRLLPRPPRRPFKARPRRRRPHPRPPQATARRTRTIPPGGRPRRWERRHSPLAVSLAAVSPGPTAAGDRRRECKIPPSAWLRRFRAGLRNQRRLLACRLRQVRGSEYVGSLDPRAESLGAGPPTSWLRTSGRLRLR
jgi:hypothetical protein